MKKIIKYLILIAGSALMAIAVKWVYNPANLVTGGFTGLSIIGDAFLKIPLWVSNLALNIPIFILTFFVVGKKTVAKSIFVTLAYSAIVAVIPDLEPFKNDIFLSSVVGGILMGAGLGLVLAYDATSGGTDMLAVVIKKFFPHLRVQWIMFFIDALIIAAGAALFGIVVAVYAVISVFITSFVTGKILDGPGYSKAVFIITSKGNEIAERIMTEVDRGVTGINAKGMYSNQERPFLFCIASRREMVRIKEIVDEEDENAFMSIFDISEVLGEGFVKK